MNETFTTQVCFETRQFTDSIFEYLSIYPPFMCWPKPTYVIGLTRLSTKLAHQATKSRHIQKEEQRKNAQKCL
jgi:hypothetical protein